MQKTSRKKLWLTITGIVIIIIILGLGSVGYFMSQVEHPKYIVISKQDNIEVRQYSPKIIAEVKVTGEREKALSQGFRLLANYIFGNNTTKTDIAMTAPVAQQASQKIAMTAPVTQQQQQDKWLVSFVMPAKYNMQTLPKPNNKLVKIIETPQQRFVVIQFSGFSSPANFQKHLKKLREYVAQKKLTIKGNPIFAYYNPPWTLPFLRRNEVMLELVD